MSRHSPKEIERIKRVAAGADFGKLASLVLGEQAPIEDHPTQNPAGITGPRLTALISNAHRLLRRRYKGLPLWVLVRDLTGNGGSTSVALCREAGYDPSQPCGGRYLRNP